MIAVRRLDHLDVSRSALYPSDVYYIIDYEKERTAKLRVMFIRGWKEKKYR